MLQQTQVATVVPFFERFLKAFPTPADLAAADEQEVLRLWEGLGYYRRARDLHRAARQLVGAHGSRLPDDPDAWRSLPGVGRYTLGAVLSQAFDRRLPILEANSERVLCRLFGEREDPWQGPVRRRLWQLAEALLPVHGSGEFNQALMELGALVCTPAAPRCLVCPLARECVALRLGLQDRIPARAAPPETLSAREVAVVPRRGRRVLLVQRPEAGRWAGMWEFPRGAVADGESVETAAARLLPELTGLHAPLGRHLLTVSHQVTRFAITLTCFEAGPPTGKFRSAFYRQRRWLRPEQLHEYPVSVPQRRLAKVLAEDRGKPLFNGL
jgi:A/G-specific adenine glycosylase